MRSLSNVLLVALRLTTCTQNIHLHPGIDLMLLGSGNQIALASVVD